MVRTYFQTSIRTDIRPELRRAAVKTGKSDIYGMADALDEGLWNDPLMDPETCVQKSNILIFLY